MKQRKPMPAMYLPKQEVKEVTLTFTNCLQCKKPILEGFYGRWDDGGVCSKTCNQLYKEARDELRLKESTGKTG